MYRFLQAILGTNRRAILMFTHVFVYLRDVISARSILFFFYFPLCTRTVNLPDVYVTEHVMFICIVIELKTCQY